jgi:hypothetical protein
MSRVSLRTRIAQARGRPCAVSGCRRATNTGGLAKVCNHHQKKRRQWGHPLGKKIPAKAYATERKAVAALLDAYPDHQGVKVALDWIANWLQQSAHGDRTQPGYVELARLHRYSVSPRDLLIWTAGVWLYSTRNPRALPDDSRLTFALAVAILRLAPLDQTKEYVYRSGVSTKYRQANRATREAIGNHLRLKLHPLYVQIVQGVENMKRAKREVQAALSVPFQTK